MPGGVALWYPGKGPHLPHPVIAAAPANDSIASFHLRTSYAVAVSEHKHLLHWGAPVGKERTKISPARTLNFLSAPPSIPPHFAAIRVLQVACNDAAVHVVAEDGTLFSWGCDRGESGVLGLGEGVFEARAPQPNQYLLEFRIVSVSVGRNHVAALDGSSQLFTWGLGTFGQLGQESVRRSCQPLLNYQTKLLKLRQIFCL